jgi:hypothetical protein
MCVAVFNRTKSGIRLNIANGVICDIVTGFSKFLFYLYSKYPKISRYRRECSFMHNHMKSASFFASDVVIVRNDNKFMFRSLMSNFSHTAQEMWEVLLELHPGVIKNGHDTSKISMTSLRKIGLSIHHFFLTHKR